jgi:CelD/BcsL family acetyltransferase involved in cellulose biosynthesis
MQPADAPPARQQHAPSRLRHVPFGDIPPERWEDLYALSPAVTPFSSWTFHRAWWDAYGSTAAEHYLVWVGPNDTPIGAPEGGPPIGAIVPLMVRAEARPTTGDSVGSIAADPRVARTLYFAATYHADYASVLAPAEHVAALAADLARHLAAQLLDDRVDVVDLRRLAEADPLTGELTAALQADVRARELSIRLEREDVCPVVHLEADWHAQLAGLGKKSRHEIRRKLRRAEREGPVELRYLPLVAASADSFIRLHQARWGADGLFADGEDGDRSRRFLRRIVELESAADAAARFHLGEVSVDGRVVHALAGFEDRETCYFYNAGLDPEARDLSPGVVGTAAYLRDRIERGDRRFDFLRGDEPYKYEWGAEDTSLLRLVITRRKA